MGWCAFRRNHFHVEFRGTLGVPPHALIKRLTSPMKSDLWLTWYQPTITSEFCHDISPFCGRRIPPPQSTREMVHLYQKTLLPPRQAAPSSVIIRLLTLLLQVDRAEKDDGLQRTNSTERGYQQKL